MQEHREALFQQQHRRRPRRRPAAGERVRDKKEMQGTTSGVRVCAPRVPVLKPSDVAAGGARAHERGWVPGRRPRRGPGRWSPGLRPSLKWGRQALGTSPAGTLRRGLRVGPASPSLPAAPRGRSVTNEHTERREQRARCPRGGHLRRRPERSRTAACERRGADSSEQPPRRPAAEAGKAEATRALREPAAASPARSPAGLGACGRTGRPGGRGVSTDASFWGSRERGAQLRRGERGGPSPPEPPAPRATAERAVRAPRPGDEAPAPRLSGAHGPLGAPGPGPSVSGATADSPAASSAQHPSPGEPRRQLQRRPRRRQADKRGGGHVGPPTPGAP